MPGDFRIGFVQTGKVKYWHDLQICRIEEVKEVLFMERENIVMPDEKTLENRMLNANGRLPVLKKIKKIRKR